MFCVNVSLQSVIFNIFLVFYSAMIALLNDICRRFIDLHHCITYIFVILYCCNSFTAVIQFVIGKLYHSRERVKHFLCHHFYLPLQIEDFTMPVMHLTDFKLVKLDWKDIVRKIFLFAIFITQLFQWILFKDVLKIVKRSFQDLKKMSKTCSLRYLLWHQYIHDNAPAS